MDNLNREIVLWRSTFSTDAYRDQLGISHSGYVVQEEIKTTITEVRQVRNQWGPGTSEGWCATDETGKKYYCNWEVFPDGSMCPCYYWLDGDKIGEFRELVDAEQAVNMGIPFVTKEGKKAIPSGFKHCDEHNIWFNGKGACWKCEYYKSKEKK